MQDSDTGEKFGHFDDANREYVITTPRTPYPWINYLGMEDLFGLISNTGGGYAFFRDAKLRRILRFRYNGLPLDGNGRYFYLRDGDDVWNPGWQPVQAELERYECRHGMGYTRILGERGGLRAEVLFFVPPGARCEIHQLTLTNLSDQAKQVTLFSFLEFCLWDALDDMTNFQRNLSCGEVEVEGSTIYHKTEYRERRDHYAFYSVQAPVAGFDTDRESFVGTLNGLHRPQAVFEGGCGTPSPAVGTPAPRISSRWISSRGRRPPTSSPWATWRTNRRGNGRPRALSTRKAPSSCRPGFPNRPRSPRRLMP